MASQFWFGQLAKEAYNRPSWSAGDGHIELIHVAFTTTATITTLSMVFGYDVFDDTLSYDSALLEESLAFMGSIEDQHEMTVEDALVRHPKDLFPHWHDSPVLFQRCEDIILSLASTTPVLPDSPLVLAHPIVWCPPNAGITLV